MKAEISWALALLNQVIHIIHALPSRNRSRLCSVTVLLLNNFQWERLNVVNTKRMDGPIF